MDERSDFDTRRDQNSWVAHVSARVLAVDDHADTRETLSALLKLEGYYVATAADGASAISMAEIFRPDVLLLDMTLPDMTGIDVLRRLRAAGFGRPAVAVSALASDSDRKAYREAGFYAFCAKPVVIDQLLRLLRELTGPRAEPPGEPA